MPDKPYFVTLKNRGLVKISGADRHDFLQSLITNDIQKLQTQSILYACLLTPQGKFLHDFFITEQNGGLWLDCEGGERTEDLAQRLSTYKLRADIEIEVEPENNVYAIFNPQILKSSNPPDPRHADLGYRSYQKPDLPERPFEEWDTRRITLTIPDGSRDMVVEKSTMLECNIDKLGGVNFDKGCYIGQELTARMHYRGLAKKHLYTVHGENFDIPKSIGEMRSTCGDIGIALLKDAEINSLKNIIL